MKAKLYILIILLLSVYCFPTKSRKSITIHHKPDSINTIYNNQLSERSIKIYHNVVDSFVNNYLGRDIKLKIKYSDSLKRFIYLTHSDERFIQEIINENRKNILTKSEINSHYLHSLDSISKVMAFNIVYNRINVFYRKFINPDTLTQNLFKLKQNEDDELLVSWVNHQVSEKEYKKYARNQINVLPNEKYYLFHSPTETWDNLAGREGYIIVRNDSIIGNIIIFMN